MTYANVDNRFDEHEKTLAVLEHEDGLAALGLWVLALAHTHAVARDQLYERAHKAGSPSANGARTTQPLGFVSRGMARRLAGAQGADLAAILAAPLPDGRTGLWEEVPGGWVFHDFPGWQQVQLWHAARESGRRGGQAKAANAAGGQGSLWAASSDPSRNPLPSSSSSSSSSSKELTPLTAAAFDEFWAVYPRKTGKRKAEQEYRLALGRADAGVILAGAVRFRDDPNRLAQFTKHPSTWLHQDCWGDDPQPPRSSRDRGGDEKFRDGLRMAAELQAEERGTR